MSELCPASPSDDSDHAKCFKKERQTFYTVTLVTEVILVAQCLFVKHLLMSALGKLWT